MRIVESEAVETQRHRENRDLFLHTSVILCAFCASVVKQFVRARECNHLHRDDSGSFP